jgi:membrane protease YdiL (CAAX protease family)
VFTNLTNFTKALIFYGLAFGLTTIVSFLSPRLGHPPVLTFLLHMYTPTVAALLMLLVVTRDGYAKSGWRSLGFQRFGIRSVGLALLAPLVLMSGVYGLVWSTGVGRFATPAGFSLVELPLNVIIGLVITASFALGEEIGFRGYMLPRLMHLGTTRAYVLSGLLHGLWHFPLLLLTPLQPIHGSWLIIGPVFLMILTAAGVFYGYVQQTGGMWLATLAHGAINQFLDLFKMFTVTTSPVLLEYMAGETGVLTLAVTVLLVGVILYRLHQQQASGMMHLPAGV